MYIGLDLGTSGVKALLMDDTQSVIGSVQAPLEVSRPAEGWSEQDPADWVNATKASLRGLGDRYDLSGVRSIGLSGQMHGAVLLDTSDTVLRPAILWNDTRSHVEAAQLDAAPQFRAQTGNIVFPGFTAPKLLWVKTHEPDIFSRVAKVLLPKDYLRLWLTGEYVSDMSDASGTSWLDPGKRDWSETLLSATSLGREHMPSLVEGSDPSGTLRSALASEFGLPDGIVVAGGAGDNAASAVGLGVARASDAFVSLGTSGVLFSASDGYAPNPETALHTFCHALPGQWHQMGVILAAADSLSWLASVLQHPPATLTGGLGALRPPGRAMFLPYLGGERTPHNDAQVRGALVGLEHVTDQNAVTRAVLEGVGFAFRDSLQAMRKTGNAPTSLIAAGGGSRSGYWLQAIATTLDMPIAVPKDGDFGAAFGAARLGMLAAEGSQAEVLSPPAIDHHVEPEHSLRPAFDEAYHRYSALYHALKDLS